MNYSNKYFHQDLFLNDNCIIDNEISNDISKNWKYEDGRPIVVGFLYQDQIDIFLAESEDDKDFEEAVRGYIKKKVDDGVDLYSFNRHMEIGNFKGTWDFDVEIKEIKPFKGRGWNKDRFWNELIARNQIPDVMVADVFDGDASLCISYWQRYIESEKIEYALKIVEHNVNCLLKESVILKQKEFFRKNFKLDERGWVIE
jgi:hypothetical protein